MKTLKEYLAEGMLDIEDNLDKDYNKLIKIRNWLNDYRHYVKKPIINNDMTIDAEIVDFSNFVDLREFPEYIKFNYIGKFFLKNCQQLRNCKGFPVKCDNMVITWVSKLTSFKDMPKNAKYTRIYLEGLAIDSLEGLPNTERLHIISLDIIDLKGMGNCKELEIQSCEKLKSLKGISKKVKDLDIYGCGRLNNINDIPKYSLNKFRLTHSRISQEDAEQCVAKNGKLNYNNSIPFHEWIS